MLTAIPCKGPMFEGKNLITFTLYIDLTNVSSL